MPDSGSHKPTGRNLPSWISSRDNDDKSKSKEPTDKSSETSLGANKSSKPLEGVVFVLSGFVNPERSTLRSQALELGAKYEPDWNNNCTLLVCAFPNTPKFRQVEAENGTIISKDWITECYNQKQLVGIEPYLLHAGKPWKHQSSSTGPSQDSNPSSSKSQNRQVDKSANSKPQASATNKKQTAHKHAKNEFSTSEVKKWAIDDMERTLSWLESQEEKPDPSEIKKVATEGILTCLQDALDSLKQGQGLGKIMEEWRFVPRVIDELNKLDIDATSKKDIYHQAIVCKRIYEFEVGNLQDETTDNKKKRPKIEKGVKTKNQTSDAAAYDSDDTVEMTEDEVRETFDKTTRSGDANEVANPRWRAPTPPRIARHPSSPSEARRPLGECAKRKSYRCQREGMTKLSEHLQNRLEARREKIRLMAMVMKDISHLSGFEYKLALQAKKDAAIELGYDVTDE